MFDLKVINSVLDQMEEERGITRDKMLDAIEQALATAYKKEYGKRGQIIRADFDITTGTTTFNQIKIVVDESNVRFEEDEEEGTEEEKPETPDESDAEDEEARVRFDAEKHILLENAQRIKKDAAVGDELLFSLESHDDFGRIAAQTAKQVIIQKIREAEKESALKEFGKKEGEVVTGHAQRFERGNLYVDLGRVTGVMPYEEQIPGERYRPGERIRAILLAVEETPRGIFLKLSRSHADFLTHLFSIEAPELQNNTVEVKAVAREAGSRSKIAVYASDSHIDPVGSLVGQRGVRVSTVMSELGGEKIDIIEWSEDPIEFIEDALSPAQVLSVTLNQEEESAEVEVAPDQQSLAIGRGGQNVRLAAKLTGWKIDIVSAQGEQLAEADGESVAVAPEEEVAPEDVVPETDVSETPVEATEAGVDRDASEHNPDEEGTVSTPEEAEDAIAEEEKKAE